MPDNILPPQYAANVVYRSGQNELEALRAYRAAGGVVSDEAWSQLYNNISTATARHAEESNRPIELAPTAEEVTPWATSRARGYIQNAQVMIYNTQTGAIRSQPYSKTTDEPTTRQNVIQEAIDTYSPEKSLEKDEVVLGASYTGTFNMTPRR